MADTAEGNNPIKTGYKIMHGEEDVTASYVITTEAGTLTINPKAVTITAQDKAFAYDGSAHSWPEYDVDGLVGNDKISAVVEGSITFPSESPVDNVVKSYEFTSGTAGNYTVTTKNGELTMKNASVAITITAASDEWTYDGSAHQNTAVTVTSGELLTGDELVAEATGSVTNVSDTAEGNNPIKTGYKIMHGEEDVTDNYAITAVAGKLTINPREVTLTSESGEKPYDGTALTKPDVTVGGDGFVDGEVSDIKATGSVTTVAEGEKTNTIVYTEGANFKADNYTITKDEGKLKITASEAALVITSSTKSWTYDGETHKDEVYTVTYDGAAATADSTGKVFTLSTGDKVTITATAAGVKDYDASYSENNTYTYEVENASSYSSVTTSTGTLSIEKREVTLTSESGEKPYDGTPLTKPTVTVGGDGFVDGEVSDIKATGSVTTVAEGEKTNTIVYTEGANFKADNYTITKTEGTLKITVDDTKPLAVESKSQSWMYNGETHTYKMYVVTYGSETLTGTEGQVEFTLSTGDKLTVTPTLKGADGVKNVSDSGDNTFTWTVENESSYKKGTDKTGTLTITTRSVTLTSATDEKTYDGTALTNDTVTVSGDGFVSGEGATYDVTGTQTLVGSSENTFTYKLNDGTLAENYVIETVNGKLTVTVDDTKPLAVESKSQSWMYDGETHTYKMYVVTYGTETLTGTEGQVEFTLSTGDKVTVTPTLKGADGVKNVSDSGDNTFTWTVENESCYLKGTDKTGTLTITTRSVKMTSADDEKVYDATALTNDTVTESGDGFVSGEGATYNVTGTQTLVGSSENTFTYTLKEGTLAENYVIEQVYGTLKVTDDGVDPALVVTKAADPGPYALGAEVTFDVTATNIYDAAQTITLSEIAGVTLKQSTFAAVAPGATVKTTATYTITEADILKGSFTNTVTAKLGNITKTAEATVNTEDPNPSLKVEKVTTSKPADGKAYVLGETITYKITVTNNGNLTAKNVEVKDDLTGDLWTVAVLKPSESKVFTASYVVTEADVLAGKVVNEVTADGETEIPLDPPTEKVEDPTEDPKPSLKVEKVTTSKPADGKAYVLGETITYKITVTNNGNLTAKNVEVKDDLTGDVWTIPSLAPGESKEFKASYVVTEDDVIAGKVVNEVTADGETEIPLDPPTEKVEDPTEDPKPHMTITKDTTSTPADGKAYGLGETITYKITAKNDGNLTITDIKITDEKTGDEWTVASLAPGESKEFTAKYVVTEDDIVAGKVVNEATGTGNTKDPEHPPVIDPGTKEDPTVDPKAHVTITKETTSKPANGESYGLDETITYKITAKNDGNLTITNLKLTDALTGDNWTVASLAPGESKEFTASFKVTQKEIDAGKVVNEVTGEGESKLPDPPVIDPGTKEDKTTGPHLTVKKTLGNTPANGTSYAIGEVILYVVQVVNDGGVTITGITVKDALTGDTWKIASLKPGETKTFTTTYRIGNADVERGWVTNTAVPSSSDMPDIPMTPGTITTTTGEYTVPLGIGAGGAQCGDCFE